MRKFVSLFTLTGVLSAALLAPVAQAEIITTQSYVQQAAASAERERVADMLEREDVRERMLAMGVDPAHVQERLAGLSDAEVSQLATQMDELPAGAGVLELLLVVILVFVVLDIAGVTDVFPFIDAAD